MKKYGYRAAALLLVVLLLSVSVCAGFTPSVAQKQAPEVKTTTNEKGEEVAAVIKDAEGKEVASVELGQLIITPLSKADEAADGIKQGLKEAYNQISEAKSLADVAPELEEVVKTLNEELTKVVEEALKEFEAFETMEDLKNAAPEDVPEELQVLLDQEIKMENLVVRDLVDVTIDDEMRETLMESGNQVTLTFDLHLNEQETLLVMHNYEADKWEIITGDDVVIHEDGSVDVTFHSLSPVAFVVNTVPAAEETAQEDAAVPAEEEQTPANKGGWVGLIVLAVGVVVIVAAVVIGKTAKKKTPQK